MNKIYISSGAFKNKSINEMLEEAKKYRIVNIELSAGFKFIDNVNEILNKSKGDFKFLFHNYFPTPKEPFLLNLASQSEVIINKSIKLAENAIDLSKKNNSEFYSVHCGFTFDSSGKHLGNSSQMDLERISMEEAYDNYICNIRHLSQYAEKKGVKLAIENNVIANFGLIDEKNYICLGADTEGLRKIFEGVNSDNLYLLLDIGHAKVNSKSIGLDIDKLIDEFEDRIIALHLSDNNGLIDSNSIINKDSDILKYIKRLKNKYLIIEVYNLDMNVISEQLNFIEEFVSDTK